MKTFRSIFNYKLLFAGILALLVPLFLATIGAWTLVKNIILGDVFAKWGLTMLMPLVCILFAYSAIRHFYKLSPRIVINGDEILIGDKRIPVSEIKHVTVRGKVTGNILFMPYSYESCSVLLANEGEYSIAVENYLNGNVIRMNFDRLNNFILGKEKRFEPIENDDDYYSSKEIGGTSAARRYMLTPFRSFNNYIFGGICVMAIWILFKIQYTSPFLIILPLGMFCLFYLVLIIQNHYFLLTDSHLIVKNLFLPSRRFAFKFDNIDYLTTEDMPKGETALKVMTKDFRIHRFQSGLLNSKMFRELIRTVNERQSKN